MAAAPAMDPLAPSPFYDLPEELLTMIVEHLAPFPGPQEAQEEHEISLKDLRALRSTCRLFAYLRRLLSILFHTLCLKASSAQLKLLSSTQNTTWLKPFVRRIMFTPWKYSWAMTPDVLEDIMLSEKLHAYCDRLGFDRAALGSGTARDFVYGGMIDESFNHTAVVRRFDMYNAKAHDTLDHFHKEHFLVAWTRLLREFAYVEHFTIGWWDYDGEDNAVRSNRDFGAHHHPEVDHPWEACRRLQIPVGEAVFTAALGAMKRAGSCIRQLDICQIAGEDLRWIGKAGLDQLNLSQLETLRFRPLTREGPDEDEPDDDVLERHEIRAGKAILLLVRACFQSLKHLQVSGQEGQTLSCFPANHMIPLPHLEHLSIGSTVRLASLAKFIHRCPKLRTLDLRPDATYGDWRHVWRAIRHHPNKITLHCEVDLDDTGPFTLGHYAGCQHSGAYRIKKCDITPDQHKSLLDYIYKRAKWDWHCEQMFPTGEEYGDAVSSDDSEYSLELSSDDDDGSDL